MPDPGFGMGNPAVISSGGMRLRMVEEKLRVSVGWDWICGILVRIRSVEDCIGLGPVSF